MKSVLKIRSIQILLLVLIIASVSCSSKKNISKKKVNDSIEFLTNEDYSLTEVIDLASAQNKQVFVDFYADWCLPCKILDEEVFNKRDVYNYFNRNFINYKVDVEKTNGANLKLIYSANELPTLLFLDQNGRVITRNNGNVSQTFIMSMAQNLVAE